jgi:predicted DsbA family dithiol-disulfide isomerase
MDENEDPDEDDLVFEKPSIIVISDFVCPWCYIGLSEVERLSQEYDLDVQFAPFFLRPDTPPEGMKHTRITPQDAPPTPIELRAGLLGINFTRGRTWLPNTHLALEAAEFAGEYGDQWRFHKEMFKAYFEDLKDIGDVEVLVEIGESAGLPGGALREALIDGRNRERVDEGIAWSRSIGVTAIPTFVFDAKYGMVGAQELPAFRQVLSQLGHEPKAKQPV